MERKKQIEFIAAGILLILLLILIINLLYSSSEEIQVRRNFGIYEKSSRISYKNGILYDIEETRSISSQNGVYNEIFSEKSFIGSPEEFYIESTYLQKNLNNSQPIQ
jgi:hypothetical protein